MNSHFVDQPQATGYSQSGDQGALNFSAIPSWRDKTLGEDDMCKSTPVILKIVISHTSKISRALFFLTGLMLAACSGGGTALPEEPTLSLSVQAIKTFHFNWNNVSGVNEYRLLENPDGISGFTQVKTIAANATSDDRVVSLPARFSARYMLEACNSAGCVDSNEVSVIGNLAGAVGYLKASNTGMDDNFGELVALAADGKTLAVGVRHEDSSATGINNGNPADDSAPESGAVYIFTRDVGGSWIQQAYIKASNTETGDQFGYSIALDADGNTLAVGAFNEDSEATGINSDENNNLASNSGAVYVFTRDVGGNWSQQAYLKASNTDAEDGFGQSIALAADGNRLAVGAVKEDSFSTVINGDQNDNSTIQSGAVYVFVRGGDTWSQQAYIKASNANTADLFGVSIALTADGNTLAVGALNESSSATGIGGAEGNNSSLQSGAVYIFTFSAGGIWSQQAYVKASNTGVGDTFGNSVALSGDTLAVGALNEDSNATGIGGNESNDLKLTSGAVYVFTRDGVTWTQQAYIKASNTEAEDGFGWSIALAADGNTLVVGAPGEDSNATGINGDVADNSEGESGAFYIFTRDGGGVWSQQAYVKASNTEVGDGLGNSVALSVDGNTIAVGAPGEDSNATGINGDQDNDLASDSGAVYLY